MRAALASSLLALLIGAPLAVAQAQTAEAPAAPAATLPAITVSTAVTRPLSDRVIVTGLIGPVEQVLVAPLVEGQPIESLLADVGDTVAAGQVLARLSRSSLELQQSQIAASLAAAKAQIAQAQAQMIDAQASADQAEKVRARTETLKQQGAATQAAYDQALAAAVSASARVAVATQTLAAARAQQDLADAQSANVALQLSRTAVVAPVSGEITQRNAQIGAIASAAGQPMFTLIRDGALELKADVSETDLPRLAVGQTANLTLAGLAQPLQGTVRLVEPTIDATTRMGRVRIALQDTTQIRAGMFVDANVLVTEHQATAVPVTAVTSAPDGDVVMKVTDGVVSRTIIKSGIRDGAWVEVLSGLQPGDTVVTKAGAFVHDGDHIAPVTDASQTN